MCAIYIEYIPHLGYVFLPGLLDASSYTADEIPDRKVLTI